MVTFEEIIDDNVQFILSPGCKTEIDGYFSNDRIDKNTLPEGWNAYDFRTTSYGNLYSIEEFVLVNHGGTFLTKQKIPMHNGRRNLSGRGGYTFA